MKNCSNIPEVALQLYEISYGLRFVCSALQDGSSDLLGILRLMHERLEDCAASLDDLPPDLACVPLRKG
ncbi:hypothetical protein LN040_03980 [Desulfovibrio subterraneus]|jgi:hypothetical protein|uniref:Uncharacterized protein n=1 Tax=Desulfovibrio subterraneus TaxID=2718620 RepID=A0A7J0BLV4_9BACT|nr:hypothetical protein [Desulfovibrio subterraneus]WBF68273.1 hypothetical protein LN040_03980 [Desulfovibrio subterraneus]GFM34221.1 hypothetical protein DSM101010T_25860 [Desulfovibrio subterraneus]